MFDPQLFTMILILFTYDDQSSQFMYNVYVRVCHCIMNHEYFIVKIFLDSLTYTKIKCPKIRAYINSNVVQGHLSKNYST